MALRYPRSGSREGFTLVELMVAITGGLFVSIAVFMLAKQSTGLYQSEARISNATLSNVVGFDRLRADLSRAGFLTTPNIKRDKKICGTPAGGYIAHLQSVMIARTDPVPGDLAANGIAPDEITLAGSYASLEQFPSAGYDPGTATFKIQPGSAALIRHGYAKAPGAPEREAILASVFGTGRIFRVVDGTGEQQFGVIAGVSAIDADTPLVHLEATPPIQVRDDGVCGVYGIGGGQESTLFNVVNLIRYSLKAVDQSSDFGKRYAPIFDTDGKGPTLSDKGRTELVREELDWKGEIIPGTEEIVAEFAVDLAFGITVADVLVTAGEETNELTTFAPGDPVNVAKWASDVSGADIDLAVGGPQLIRAVRARLSVRSRQADRTSGMPAVVADGGGAPISPGLYRYDTSAGFARVRTVQSDVALRSQMGATWL